MAVWKNPSQRIICPSPELVLNAQNSCQVKLKACGPFPGKKEKVTELPYG
jgi:hypothetical protein